MDWSAEQYIKFEKERTRPVRDLVAQIPNVTIRRAVDIGCGPGNSTEVLRERFPLASIIGIDSSPNMIASARNRLPNLQFHVADIVEWQGEGEPFDVILANAVLQWLPDHATLLPSLLGKLTSGGSLVVQMPDNLQEPSHRLMREIANNGEWRDKLVGAARELESRRPADWYHNVLRESGATTVDIWRTTYYHPLPGGAKAIVEWFQSTGLRPFLQPLEEGERSTFLKRYESALTQAYPTHNDGTVLLPFPRLFFVATR